jgi:hypothetical protein
MVDTSSDGPYRLICRSAVPDVPATTRVFETDLCV